MTSPPRARLTLRQLPLRINRKNLLWMTCLLVPCILQATPSWASDIALEPPASPTKLRIMVQGGYHALHESTARTFRLDNDAAALSIAGVLELLEVMSFAATLGTIFVDHRPEAPADGAEGDEENVNVLVASLAAGLRSPTLRLALKHHDSAYPAMWMSVRYGYAWHNADNTVDCHNDCDRWAADSDGSFLEGVLTGARLGGPIGLVADIGYRYYLQQGLTHHAATLGLGVSW